jgi:hypothetical protein
MTIKLKKIIKRGVGIKPYTSRLYYILYMYFIFIFRVFLWHVDMIANAYHLLVVLKSRPMLASALTCANEL